MNYIEVIAEQFKVGSHIEPVKNLNELREMTIICTKRGFSAPIEDKINKLFYEFNKSIEEKKEQIQLEQIKILIELKNEKKEKNYLEIIKKNFEKIINLFDFRIEEDYNSNLEYIKNLQKIMEEDYQTNFKTKIKKFKKDQFISNQKEFIHENLKEKKI